MAATSNTGTRPPRLPHPSTISPRGSADRLIRAEASTAPRRQLLPPSRGDYLAPPLLSLRTATLRAQQIGVHLVDSTGASDLDDSANYVNMLTR
jgi:hypothetical protein